MKLTITQAAKKWHITRQTVYSKMKAGELSYELDDDGKRQIDVSEMVRAFGEPDTTKRTRKEAHTLTDKSDVLIQTLQEQLAIAQKRIEAQDLQILSLLRELQSDVTRFIEHQPIPMGREIAVAEPVEESLPAVRNEPAPVPQAEKPKRGFLARIALAALDG